MTGRVMTEAEAAEVWCPWSIGVIHAGQGAERTTKTANRHRNGEFPEGCQCLGPMCAAWLPQTSWTAEEMRTRSVKDPPPPARGSCGNVRGYSS